MKKNINNILIKLTLITSVIYMYWRIFYTIPINLGKKSLIIGILFLILEIWEFIEFIIHYINILKNSQRHKFETLNNQLNYQNMPHVDIIIATIDEDAKLLKATIEGCLKIDYDKDKLHIYISDDGNRKEICKLAKKYKINYITREDNVDAKAGNYNNALKYLKSEYILTLDADMIPNEVILKETIPYLINDSNMGFVQTPQYFYNYDIYQYRFGLKEQIPFDQNFFYQVLQTEKEKINAVVYCGTNAVISRKALDSIGGFATGTLTEDIATRNVNSSQRI